MIKVDAWIMRKFIARKRVTDNAVSEVEDGGKGSGNFGHKGRPGLRGGSGKGGGKAFRTETRETLSGYIGIQRAKAFKSIANNARNYTSYDSFANSLSKEQSTALQNQFISCGTKENSLDYYKRIYDMLHNRPAQKRAENKPVEGKDIFATYTPKRDRAAGHEIEQVIHEQGFDGVPKIVSQKEFKELIDNNPKLPVLFRSYSASDAETLQKYDDMLEGGKWYIDCGTGGAQYGQGMYCAGVYGENKKYDGAESEMKHYREINEDRCERNISEDVIGSFVPEGCAGIFSSKTNKIYAYKKDELKDIKDVEPADGQTIVLDYWGGTEVIKFENGTYYNLDKSKRYRPPAAGDKWAPITKEVAYKPDPQSSTRVMTLDPSAKIVSYFDVKRIAQEKKEAFAKEQEKRIKEEAKKALATAPNPQQLRDGTLSDILYGYRGKREKPTDSELKPIRDALYNLYKNDWNAYKQVRSMLSGYSTGRWESDEKLVEKIITERANDYRLGKFANNASAYPASFQAFYALPGVKEAFEGVIARASARADRTWRSAFITDYVNTETAKIGSRFYNIGSIAAALGYDAINAEGHGSTGSYTVVLNRTKVILCDQRVKMGV